MSLARPSAYLLACLTIFATAAARADVADAPDQLTLRLADLPASQPAAPAQSWADQVKNPAPGFTWGADERIRNEYLNNAITLNGNVHGHELDFFRYRTRIWADYNPCKEFEVYTRLAWEGRYWVENPATEWTWGQLFFDNLYGKFKLPNIGLTVTAGRQDIILGDGWLVLEGTPLDGSTSIFMNAIRTTLDLKDAKMKIDGIFIQDFSSPDVFLPTISDTDVPLIEQNERGAILYVTNNAIKNVQIDSYFIYKHDEKVLSNGDNGDIYTFGTRVAPKFTDNLNGRVELAGQFGDKNGRDLLAWGANTRLTWNFNDAMNNQLYLAWEYLSGGKPGDSTDQAFDPLWGRWPQWSELYVYSYKNETRIAQTTNLDRVGIGYVVNPTKPMEIDLTTHALFANENTLRGTAGYSAHGNYRGQLFTAILKYKFSPNIATHLWSEFFIPGNYYDTTKQSDAVYLRAEVVFTF